MTEWLSPARRRAIYAVLAIVGLAVQGLGLSSEAQVTAALTLIDASLAFAALIMAAVKSRRWEFQSIYAAGAVVVGALVPVGLLTEGQSGQVLRILGALAAAAPLVVAAFRTDPATPTGEPAREFVRRVGQ